MNPRLNIETVILNERLLEWGLPLHATAGSAAMDLRSLEEEPIVLGPQQTHKFQLGFAMHVADPGIAAFILPRSGLGSNEGLVLANTIGLIDSDYHGPMMTVALNRKPVGGDSIFINPGDRIFQMVFLPVVLTQLMQVTEFSQKSGRGSGGYGSTGR